MRCTLAIGSCAANDFEATGGRLDESEPVPAPEPVPAVAVSVPVAAFAELVVAASVPMAAFAEPDDGA